MSGVYLDRDGSGGLARVAKESDAHDKGANSGDSPAVHGGGGLSHEGKERVAPIFCGDMGGVVLERFLDAAGPGYELLANTEGDYWGKGVADQYGTGRRAGAKAVSTGSHVASGISGSVGDDKRARIGASEGLSVAFDDDLAGAVGVFVLEGAEEGSGLAAHEVGGRELLLGGDEGLGLASPCSRGHAVSSAASAGRLQVGTSVVHVAVHRGLLVGTLSVGDLDGVVAGGGAVELGLDVGAARGGGERLGVVDVVAVRVVAVGLGALEGSVERVGALGAGVGERETGLDLHGGSTGELDFRALGITDHNGAGDRDGVVAGGVLAGVGNVVGTNNVALDDVTGGADGTVKVAVDVVAASGALVGVFFVVVGFDVLGSVAVFAAGADKLEDRLLVVDDLDSTPGGGSVASKVLDGVDFGESAFRKLTPGVFLAGSVFVAGGDGTLAFSDERLSVASEMVALVVAVVLDSDTGVVEFLLGLLVVFDDSRADEAHLRSDVVDDVYGTGGGAIVAGRIGGFVDDLVLAGLVHVKVGGSMGRHGAEGFVTIPAVGKVAVVVVDDLGTGVLPVVELGLAVNHAGVVEARVVRLGSDNLAGNVNVSALAFISTHERGTALHVKSFGANNGNLGGFSVNNTNGVVLDCEVVLAVGAEDASVVMGGHTNLETGDLIEIGSRAEELLVNLSLGTFEELAVVLARHGLRVLEVTAAEHGVLDLDVTGRSDQVRDSARRQEGSLGVGFVIDFDASIVARACRASVGTGELGAVDCGLDNVVKNEFEHNVLGVVANSVSGSVLEEVDAGGGPLDGVLARGVFLDLNFLFLTIDNSHTVYGFGHGNFVVIVIESGSLRERAVASVSPSGGRAALGPVSVSPLRSS